MANIWILLAYCTFIGVASHIASAVDPCIDGGDIEKKCRIADGNSDRLDTEYTTQCLEGSTTITTYYCSCDPGLSSKDGHHCHFFSTTAVATTSPPQLKKTTTSSGRDQPTQMRIQTTLSTLLSKKPSTTSNHIDTTGIPTDEPTKRDQDPVEETTTSQTEVEDNSVGKIVRLPSVSWETIVAIVAAVIIVVVIVYRTQCFGCGDESVESSRSDQPGGSDQPDGSGQSDGSGQPDGSGQSDRSEGDQSEQNGLLAMRTSS